MKLNCSLSPMDSISIEGVSSRQHLSCIELQTEFEEDDDTLICLNSTQVEEMIAELNRLLPALKEAELTELLTKGANHG